MEPKDYLAASSPVQPSARLEDGEFNLLHGLWLLLHYSRLLLCVGLTTLLLSTAYAFLSPKVYTATTRLIVPSSTHSPLLGGLGELTRLAGGLPGSSGGDLYVGIARSRSVAAPVIEKFKLREVYDVPYAEDAYQMLNRRLDATFDSKETLLTLAVRDRDPQRAASLANALVEELERRSIELNLGSASQERAFLEKRLANVKEGLAAAEDALKQFQQEHRAFGLDEQAKAVIEALGRLQGELAGKEIELGVLRTFQTERNPQVRALTSEIEEIRRQLMALEKSPAGSQIAGGGMVPTGEMPELAIRFGRLLRDYKVQEVLYELLAKQYELARVEEVKTTSRLQVLDPAVPPERKSAPKRLFIMVLATSSTLFLTIVAIFAFEAWRKATASEPELAERIRQELCKKRAWK